MERGRKVHCLLAQEGRGPEGICQESPAGEDQELLRNLLAATLRLAPTLGTAITLAGRAERERRPDIGYQQKFLCHERACELRLEVKWTGAITVPLCLSDREQSEKQELL